MNRPRLMDPNPSIRPEVALHVRSLVRDTVAKVDAELAAITAGVDARMPWAGKDGAPVRKHRKRGRQSMRAGIQADWALAAAKRRAAE